MRTMFIAAPVLALLSGCGGNSPEGQRGAEDAGAAIANAVGDTSAAVGNGIEDMGNAIAGPVKPGRYDEWVGKWVGVEGTYLDIKKPGDEDASADYALTMQYDLDHKGTYDGKATKAGIAFSRPDGDYVLKKATGDEIGLKWLAGKQDCLMVKQGEGYCRD
ncbi:hypothetical protein [Stakelama pacifica]|uniref:Lipoprotein n=1 Tax=Stakelama pacifica TaxID=517720 RepID=A0A4R6FDI8_9SPHN|nr:hypothetical protein [Stakelama pacifica]TDN79321.1 hypothetical protein EV664_11399 [Stakelama pacifica]GGO98406.1 hypothetical protein GCM10011329_29500 [Stakelama pacifica]